MPQTFGAPRNISSAPPPAPVGSPGNGMMHNAMSAAPPPPAYAGDSMLPSAAGASGGTQRGAGRIPPAMLEGLPPEFVQALSEIAELVDIDGDGQPDMAMVPLNQVGAAAAPQMNAMARMGQPQQPFLGSRPR